MTGVLVLGAAGMLGHKVLQALAAAGHEVAGTIRSDVDGLGRAGRFLSEIAPNVERIDATDLGSVRRAVNTVDPGVVVNCIGVIKQRPAATDSVTSIKVNALFPHQLARLCAESGRQLIHFSTDCVFSGRRGSYVEDDLADAIDLYGRTKLLGEVGAPSLTLRTSLVGRELSSSGSLVEWFLSMRGSVVRGFVHAKYSGITTVQAAATVCGLVETKPILSGLYHVSGPVISKYELLQAINSELDLGIDIVPETEFVLDRTLVGDRFVLETGFHAPSWADMIREMAGDPTPYEEIR